MKGTAKYNENSYVREVPYLGKMTTVSGSLTDQSSKIINHSSFSPSIQQYIYIYDSDYEGGG